MQIVHFRVDRGDDLSSQLAALGVQPRESDAAASTG
jgi:hypothetical protein